MGSPLSWRSHNALDGLIKLVKSDEMMQKRVLSVFFCLGLVGFVTGNATDLDAEKERARRLLRQTEPLTKFPTSAVPERPPIAVL